MAWNTFASDYKADDVALSNGNLTATVGASGTNGTYYGVGSIEAKCNAGKWHWEITVDTINGGSYPISIGIVKDDFKTATFEGDPKTGNDHWLYHSDGQKSGIGDTGSAYGATYTSGDRITVELDLDNDQIEFFKNGSSQGTLATGNANFRDLPWFPAVILVKDAGGNNAVTANFGATSFTDTPTAGFVGVDTVDTTGNATFDRTLTENGQGDNSLAFRPCACNAGTAIRQASAGGGGGNSILCTFPKNSGKYYFELTGIGEGGPAGSEATWFGVVNSTFNVDTDDIDTSANAWTFENGSGLANKINNGTTTAYGTAGDPEAQTLMCAVDLDNSKIWAGREGTWFASGDPAAGTGFAFDNLSGSNFRIVVDDTYSVGYHVIKLNTGQEAFNHTAPSGFNEWDSTDPKNADGLVTAEPVIAAGATINATHSDGLVTAAPVITGTADLPAKHADGSVEMVGAIDAEASNPNKHADGAVEAVGVVTASAITGPVFEGVMSFVPMTVAASMVQQKVFSLDQDMGLIEVNGQILNGPTYQADLTMPSLEVEAYGPGFAAGILPALTSSGLLVTGNAYNLNRNIRKMTMVGSLEVPSQLVADFSLRRMTMNAQLMVGVSLNLAKNMAKLKMSSTSVTGNVLDSALIFPAFDLDSEQGMSGLASFVGELPAMYMTGYILNGSTLIVTGWAANTETFDVANYTNYTYTKLGQFNGQSYGIKGDGVYLLEGADDAGTAIPARFVTGFEDFGTENLKHMPYAYVGYRADGCLTVKTKIDGEELERSYELARVSNTSGIKHARVKLARGVKSRYWQVGVENVEGADFEIDELGFVGRPLVRKT
ncbi:MAG: hypothetical protein GTN99_08085 [Candidatus Dadabacteria bacterium]|nr:hypothetical protein [Candidatus Dadabacteria bacterium]